MDLKKVAVIKPSRGNYDAGTTHAYHSEWAECITGVLGSTFTAGGLAGLAILGAGVALSPLGLLLLGVIAVGGGLTGYATFC